MGVSPSHATSTSNSTATSSTLSTPAFSFDVASDFVSAVSHSGPKTTFGVRGFAQPSSIRLAHTGTTNPSHSQEALELSLQDIAHMADHVPPSTQSLTQFQSQSQAQLLASLLSTASTASSLSTPSTPAFPPDYLTLWIQHQQQQQQIQQLQLLFQNQMYASYQAQAQQTEKHCPTTSESQKNALLRDYLLGVQPSPSLDAATAQEIMRLSSSNKPFTPTASPLAPSTFLQAMNNASSAASMPTSTVQPMWFNSSPVVAPYYSCSTPGSSASTFPAAHTINTVSVNFTSLPSPSNSFHLQPSPTHSPTSPDSSSRFISAQLDTTDNKRSSLQQNARPIKRRRREPGAPKHPLSAYLFYVAEQRQLYAKTAFSAKRTFTEMAQLLGQRWRNMNRVDREPYEKKADLDKQRYEQEKRDHQRRKTIAAAQRAMLDIGPTVVPSPNCRTSSSSPSATSKATMSPQTTSSPSSICASAHSISQSSSISSVNALTVTSSAVVSST